MIFKRISKEFWKYGTGAMTWRGAYRKDPYLMVLFPPFPGTTGPDNRSIYPFHNETDWSKSGEVLGWNGQIQYPSFYPTFFVQNEQWYIIEGRLFKRKGIDMEISQKDIDDTRDPNSPSTPEELSEELMRLGYAS